MDTITDTTSVAELIALGLIRTDTTAGELRQLLAETQATESSN